MGEERQRARLGERTMWSFHTLFQGYRSLQTSTCLQTWELSKLQTFGVFFFFFEASFHRYYWLNYWPLMVLSLQQPLSPPWRSWGGAERANHLIMHWFSREPGATWQASLSRIINITKDTLIAFLTKDILKVLGALCQKSGQRPHICFLL